MKSFTGFKEDTLVGIPPFGLRMPEDVKQWIEAQATKNMRSQNAEIVFILREAMKAEKEKGEATA